MYPDPQRKGKIIGIVALFGLLFIVVVLLLMNPGDDMAPTDGTQTLTPGTPQSQTTPPASDSPQSEQGQTGITYEGFVELSRYGLTSFQMEGVKYAFYQFNQNATKFKIDPSTIQQSPYDRDNPTDFVQLTFKMQIDGKSNYTAKVDSYTDLTTIRVYLIGANGQTVYDSQPFNSNSIQAPSTNTTPGA